MNCKKHEQLEILDVDTIDLLNNHPPLVRDKYLTDKIMTAVLNESEQKKSRKSFNYSFELKLANSLICTGVFLLITNILTINSNTYIYDGFRETICNFNNMLTNIMNYFN
ncbi:hypothetical protein [Vallitalea longa]|uniref:hypothetical protein n=1 Tax=Vallitalea longa TaxID=2936439 RepID=UPI00249167E7|nr:hypothetical protein [Vallitalea longa]